MWKLYMLVIGPGPALLGWSAGWLVGVATGRQRVQYEHDLIGAAIGCLVAVLASVLAYGWGIRRYRRYRAEGGTFESNPWLPIVMAAAGCLGVLLFALAALGILR